MISRQSKQVLYKLWVCLESAVMHAWHAGRKTGHNTTIAQKLLGRLVYFSVRDSRYLPPKSATMTKERWATQSALYPGNPELWLSPDAIVTPAERQQSEPAGPHDMHAWLNVCVSVYKSADSHSKQLADIPSKFNTVWQWKCIIKPLKVIGWGEYSTWR